MQLPAHTDISDAASGSNIPAFRLIADQLSLVEDLINEQLTASDKTGDIQPLLDYVRCHTGKMILPGLVLLAGSCCGKITNEHLRIAAIIEMMHNATLLHGDVIDGGQKPRVLPTINSLWSNESAVLSGDFLLSRVFKMCADLEPQVVKIIATSAVRLCEGELRQVVQRHNWQLSESDYIGAITEKSAVLFGRACYLGAVLAQANESHTKSLADFGLYAGIAFQITDDLLDIIGDKSKTGKTFGSDFNKHKLTLAVIHLLREVDEREKKVIINSYLEKKNTPYDRGALTEMLIRHGSLQYTNSRAQEFAVTAVQALAGINKSKAKDALIETAAFMAGRAI